MTFIRLSRHGWFVITITCIVILLYMFSSPGTVSFIEGDVVSIERVLNRSLNLIKEAGDFVKFVYHSQLMNVQKKYIKDEKYLEPLTDADIGSHKIIFNGLLKSFIRLKLRSEESFNAKLKNIRFQNTDGNSALESTLVNKDFVHMKDLVVWIDPLDGTQEYTEGLLDYVTLMICIVHGNKPIAGIIHQPFRNKTYWAWKNLMSSDLKEAVKNRPNTKKLPKDNLFVTYSRSHLNDTVIQGIKKQIGLENVKFISAGGSGFKSLSLILGNADLYIHPSSIRRWDVCAAQAVLESVGGRLTDFKGHELDYSFDAKPEISRDTGILATFDSKVHSTWIDKLKSL